MTPTVKATLATATTVVLWASAFVGIRSAGHALQAGPLALLRLVAGTAALGALLLWRRRTPGGRAPMPGRRDLGALAVTGVLWFGLYNVWLNAAERRLDAGTSAMLIGIGPVLIALIAGVALREGLPRPLLLALPVAFGGLLLIGFGTQDSGSHHNGAGPVLLCVGAAVAYAVAMVVQKPPLKRVPPLEATFLCCVAGLIMCLPYAPALADEARHASGSSLAWAVYLGVFPTAVGFTTWAYALARISAGRLAITTYVVPPISILLGWLMLGETPTWLAVGGGALCLGGVAISRLPDKAKARPATLNAAAEPVVKGA